MGQEIATSRFTNADFERFQAQVRQETDLLQHYFKTHQFANEPAKCGLELEAWLVTSAGNPAPLNSALLARLDHPLIGPELAKCNIEFNTTPQPCPAFERLAAELSETWQLACAAATALDTTLISIGTLPSARVTDFNPETMSVSERYRALNEQMMRQHQGQQFEVAISGKDTFRHTCSDLMLEAATTSWQVHLQLHPAQAVRFYNAALIASAAVVALAANSPFLFGYDLWQESRIPLFEQVIDIPQGPNRVTFGQDYATDSLLDCFLKNLSDYPILLPINFETPPEHFSHLSLHNGTIWRWNRPIIGTPPDQLPHLRLEHRIMAAPPTLSDGIASTAFFLGLVQALATQAEPPEASFSFAAARDYFYAAAREGLLTPVTWLDGCTSTLQALILTTLLPLAEVGLDALAIPSHYLDIVRDRCASNQTGATWQRQFIQNHGPDFGYMVHCYRQHQVTGTPVHTWSLT